jgi:hypothetical protein
MRKHLLAAVCFVACIPLLPQNPCAVPSWGQIVGPETANLGELVVLGVEQPGNQQWEASDPEDLVWVATAEGGVAFSAGCKQRTITIRCYLIDWERKSFSVDKHRITVGGDSPTPDDPPPVTDLSDVAKAARDAFADQPAAIKAVLPTVADNFAAAETIADANAENKASFVAAGVWADAESIYRGLLTTLLRDHGLTQDNVRAVCKQVAIGLRAVR